MRYKVMRVLCMFDLPTDTAKEKKAYRIFRENLLKEGFVMLQYSVYMRTCPSREYGNRLTKRIEYFSPSNGHIRLIMITEKQYEDMKIVIGSKSNTEKKSGHEKDNNIMKKLKVILHNEEEVELNFSQVIQIIGSNGEKKQHIINEIAKYFSKYKYSEWEEHDNNEIIKIDEESIGRNAFKTIHIEHIKDIEENFKNIKSSMLYEYLEGLVQNIDINKAVHRINDEIQTLVQFFNERIDIESIDISISSIDYEFKELFKNNLNIEVDSGKNQYIKYISNIKKIKSFLELLVKNNERFPERKLVILENIDNYISKEEYNTLLQKIIEISNTTDIHFILTTNKEGYVYLNEKTIEGINVINEIVFNISNLEMLHKYIENNYPYYRQFNKDELIEKLIPIFNQIGSKVKIVDVSSLVMLKIINNSENIEMEGIEKVNINELKYIQKK